MHDQLRDMALAIVRSEGKISQRSRVRGQDAEVLLQKQVLMSPCAWLCLIMPRRLNTASRACSCVQGVLECIEGLSITGLPSPVNTDALGRMPYLRILIFDYADVKQSLTGVELRNLAMLSWRCSLAEELPLHFHTMQNAAVLDFGGCINLVTMPDGLEVRILQAVTYVRLLLFPRTLAAA